MKTYVKNYWAYKVRQYLVALLMLPLVLPTMLMRLTGIIGCYLDEVLIGVFSKLTNYDELHIYGKRKN